MLHPGGIEKVPPAVRREFITSDVGSYSNEVRFEMFSPVLLPLFGAIHSRHSAATPDAGCVLSILPAARIAAASQKRRQGQTGRYKRLVSKLLYRRRSR